PAGKNRTALLKKANADFGSALGRRPEDVRTRLLWAYGNTLRRLLDADLRARRGVDPEEAPLPESVGELLADLVQQFNVYAMGDRLLSVLDAQSLGPRDRAEVLAELHAGSQVVRAVQTAADIMDGSAAQIMSVAAAAAESAAKQTGVNAEQALANALEVQRNGGIAIIRRAVLELKEWGRLAKEGAFRELGAEMMRKLVFAPFVQSYEASLRHLLGGLSGAETVRYVLDLLRRLLSGG
ncbi:MAG TPA: hypothetical protein VGC92_16085, partial [Phenylobacterium sp.]